MKYIYINYQIFYSLGNTAKDYIESNITYLAKELKDMGVTVLDNKYKDIKVNRNTISIGGVYIYTLGVNGNNGMDKYTMEEGFYDFITDFQNIDNYKLMMVYRAYSFIFGNR